MRFSLSHNGKMSDDLQRYVTSVELPDSSPGFLLYLAEDESEQLTSYELAAIRTIAFRLQNAQSETWVAVVSGSLIRGLYARIVFLSFGVGVNQIHVRSDVGQISWGSGCHIETPESTQASIIDDVTKYGCKVFPIPVLPLPMHSVREHASEAVVVLGNQPLDEYTPTVDLMKRVLAGVKYFAEKKDAFLVFSGGATTGGISEAKMMEVIALSHGIPAGSYILEEEAYSTHQNVDYVSRILTRMGVQQAVLVTKPGHLETASSLWRALQPQMKLTELPVDVSAEEITAQMDDYLSVRKDSLVEKRKTLLKMGVRGVD